jgi:uncharacterized protein (DUF488 family)
MKAATVFTVGHSNHSLERLVALLRSNAVNAAADVRSFPYSRANQDFNREALQRALNANGIAYVYLGRELGGRPADPSCYEQGRVQYHKVARTPLFKDGLERVLKGIQTYRIVLLCAEKEPLFCHRTLLIGQELAALGVAVLHIHADGTLESHSEAMNRLVAELGLVERDLYRTKEEMIADACALQAKRIAYVDGEMAEGVSA